MNDFLLFNSYYTEQLYSISQKIVEDRLRNFSYNLAELKEEILGSKTYHMMVGCEKFMWSFVSTLERSL
ncbi:hypothetical protein D3C80_2166030 [compost metagenome]